MSSKAAWESGIVPHRSAEEWVEDAIGRRAHRTSGRSPHLGCFACQPFISAISTS